MPLSMVGSVVNVVSVRRRGYQYAIHLSIPVHQDDWDSHGHPLPVPTVRAIQPTFAVVVIVSLGDDWPEDKDGQGTSEEKEGDEGDNDKGFEAKEQARGEGDGM